MKQDEDCFKQQKSSPAELTTVVTKGRSMLPSQFMNLGADTEGSGSENRDDSMNGD